MKEFLLLFRADWQGMPKPSPEEASARTQMWTDWVNQLQAKNNLVATGQRLHVHGKVVKPKGVVTDGPFIESKESVGGYTIIKAASYEEAAELSKTCPILAGGGNVEVREIWPM